MVPAGLHSQHCARLEAVDVECTSKSSTMRYQNQLLNDDAVYNIQGRYRSISTTKIRDANHNSKKSRVGLSIEDDAGCDSLSFATVTIYIGAWTTRRYERGEQRQPWNRTSIRL